MSRQSFQNGTLQKINTARGFTWVVRYMKDGKRKAMTIGKSDTMPTEVLARRRMSELATVINDKSPVYTFGQLTERFIAEALPERMQSQSSYRSNLKHLCGRWNDVPVLDMKKDIMAIQVWFADLKTTAKPGHPARQMSKKSKQHIKALLHRIFNCGMKWGYLPLELNPISLVEIKMIGIVPKKRVKIPLSVLQVNKIINDPALLEHVRVMTKLCVFQGLGISEVLGLRWEDVNFEAATISINRSSVGAHLGDTKTDARKDDVTFSTYIDKTLRAWQAEAPSVDGWIFGNMSTGRPFHRDSLQTDHLAPCGVRNGISGLGWHTFRHTHVDILRNTGASSEAQMYSMRHSDMRTTNEYGRDGGSLQLKRSANQALVEAIVGREEVLT